MIEVKGQREAFGTDQVELRRLCQQLDIGAAAVDARLEVDLVPEKQSQSQGAESERRAAEERLLLDDERFGVEGERSQQPGRDGVMFSAGLQDQTFVSGELTVLHLLHGPFPCDQHHRERLAPQLRPRLERPLGSQRSSAFIYSHRTRQTGLCDRKTRQHQLWTRTHRHTWRSLRRRRPSWPWTEPTCKQTEAGLESVGRSALRSVLTEPRQQLTRPGSRGQKTLQRSAPPPAPGPCRSPENQEDEPHLHHAGPRRPGSDPTLTAPITDEKSKL